jgi:hypothetical protein
MVIAFLMRNIILKTKKGQGKQLIVKTDIKKLWEEILMRTSKMLLSI